MRKMALDHGARRVGIAVTDPTGVAALPLETVARSRALDRLAVLVDEYEVGEIVVGLPLHMDGRAGEEAERARRFGAAVARRTGVPVHYLDERWTTREAERALRGSRRAREGVDDVAAALLLRAYLDGAAVS